VTGASTIECPASRTDRGAVDEQRAGRGAVRGAVGLTEQHLFDLRAIDHHRDHELGACRRGGRRLGNPRVVSGAELLGGRPGAVPHGQLELCVGGEVGRHPGAHDPEAEKRDAHRRHDTGTGGKDRGGHPHASVARR
jgi:hypothetical protein